MSYGVEPPLMERQHLHKILYENTSGNIVLVVYVGGAVFTTPKHLVKLSPL